ncbi:MAG: ClpXP protease specificity-enhancing factor [Pseudomonadota bacterium]
MTQSSPPKIGNSMSPMRPYLLRALYQWIVDNQCTPCVIIDAREENVQVPVEFVEDGEIALNIAPDAVNNLEIGTHRMTFDAGFNGIKKKIVAPLKAVMSIYAAEHGQGMVFEPESWGELEAPEPEQQASINKVPDLRLVD